MGRAPVQLAAERLAAALDELGIPYAICGGLAVAAHGHIRYTEDVDVLLTADGLARFKKARLGRGWVERFPGSRGLRDAAENVRIDVLVTGDFPGDGKPGPVAFPDPADAVMAAQGASILQLARLVELKLASGLSAPARLQDFADVIALIRSNQLAREYALELAPYVRPKYDELWELAQTLPDEA